MRRRINSSTRKTKSARPRTRYVPPITFEGFKAMTDAVHASNLPLAMQLAIEGALFSLWIMVHNETAAHKLGRYPELKTWKRAEMVMRLVDELGVSLKGAVNAVLGPGVDDPSLKKNLVLHVGKIRRGECPLALDFVRSLNTPASYAQAVSHLRKGETNRG